MSKNLILEVFKSFHELPILCNMECFKPKTGNYGSQRSGLTFQIPTSKVYVNSFEFRDKIAWNHPPRPLKKTLF